MYKYQKLSLTFLVLFGCDPKGTLYPCPDSNAYINADKALCSCRDGYFSSGATNCKICDSKQIQFDNKYVDLCVCDDQADTTPVIIMNSGMSTCTSCCPPDNEFTECAPPACQEYECAPPTCPDGQFCSNGSCQDCNNGCGPECGGCAQGMVCLEGRCEYASKCCVSGEHGSCLIPGSFYPGAPCYCIKSDGLVHIQLTGNVCTL